MKWIKILQRDDVALLQNETDTQYAVVSGYDPTQPNGQQWNSGNYFMYWNNGENKAEMLMAALDLFRYKTENRYISRSRLEELATKFKDGLYSYTFVEEGDDYFFDEECEMEDYEKKFFGLLDEEGE